MKSPTLHGQTKKPSTAWKTLPSEFLPTITEVLKCCGMGTYPDGSNCVHFHPDFIEACDNHQAFRVELSIGLTSELLVLGKHLAEVLKSRPVAFALSRHAIHFRNAAGYVVDCERSTEAFEPLDDLLEVEGTKVTWPRGTASLIKEAAKVARLSEVEEIEVKLAGDKLSILAKNRHDRFKKSLPIDLRDKPRSFSICPNRFLRIAAKYPGEWTLGRDRMTYRSGAVSQVIVIC